MKIRNGFVSNSSSCSFMVMSPEPICDEDSISKYIELGISDADVSAEISCILNNTIKLDDNSIKDFLKNSIYWEVSNICDKKFPYDRNLTEIERKIRNEKRDKFRENLLNERSEVLLKELKEENKDYYFYEMEFSDHDEIEVVFHSNFYTQNGAKFISVSNH